MAGEDVSNDFINEFPLSFQTLALDTFFSPLHTSDTDTNCTSGLNGDSKTYTILHKNVLLFAEKMENELQTMKDVILHKDNEILLLTDKVHSVYISLFRNNDLIHLILALFICFVRI